MVKPELKIAILVMSMTRRAGGLFYSVRYLAESLERLFVSLRVLSGCEHEYKSDVDKWQLAHEPECVYKFKPYSFGYMPRYSRKLKEMKPTLIHLHGIWSYHAWAALRYKKRFPDVKLVISPRGMLDEWSLENSKFKKMIARFLYVETLVECADGFHALCQREKQSILAIRANANILLSPNGVDASRYSVSSCELNGQFKLLFLGRIHPKKGVDKILRALSLLPHEMRVKIKFTIAGWGDKSYEDSLQRLVEKLFLSDVVEFVGAAYDDEKTSLLQSSNAFILPSLSEGLPMAVLEAWASGLPTLLTSQCGFTEEMNSRFVVRIQHSPESIAEGLVKLMIKSQDELYSISKEARQHAERSYSWDYLGMEMLDFYKSL